MSDVKAKSEWVHRFANINQTFEVISSSSTQVIYRNVDGYGQQTMLRHDFLETFRPKSVVDDTFNDDTPKAAQILNEAVATMVERGKSYDKDGNGSERSMDKIVAMFEALTGIAMTPAQGYKFMACLKLARS
jgi:hypothetical protein